MPRAVAEPPKNETATDPDWSEIPIHVRGRLTPCPAD